MNDFQAKSLWRRTIYSRPVIVLLAIIIVLLLRPVWNIWRKARVVAEEQAQVAAQLAELESRRNFLQQEIAALGTARGVEGEIRKKFPVVREGEKVIIIGEDVTVAASTTATSTGWFDKLENLFK